MSDPYAPPGSQRDASPGADRGRPLRELPPSAPQPSSAPRAPRGEPDAAGALRTARLGLRFSLLVLAGLVAMSLPLPWRAGGLAFLFAGGVVGVFAVVSAVRARLRASTVVALSIGLAMTAVLMAVQALTLVFWPLTAEREACVSRALTATSLQACETAYTDGLQGLVPGSSSLGG